MDAALHEWNLSPKQAIALQSRLAKQLESRDRIDPVRYIAGGGYWLRGGGRGNAGGGGRIEVVT